MYFTIDALINNNSEILKYYQNALLIWDDILRPMDLDVPSSVGKLAKELSMRQSQFEHQCGGRNKGKEIMAITGIVKYYSVGTGFETEWGKPNEYRKRKARNIYNAILFSSCSAEVKFAAKRIAKIYGLVES